MTTVSPLMAIASPNASPIPMPVLVSEPVSRATSVTDPFQPPDGSRKTHAEPAKLLSHDMPTTIVSPSTATPAPNLSFGALLDAVSFACSFNVPRQPPSGLTKTYAEPRSGLIAMG